MNLTFLKACPVVSMLVVLLLGCEAQSGTKKKRNEATSTHVSVSQANLWEKHPEFANALEEREWIVATIETMYEKFRELEEEIVAKNDPDMLNSVQRTLAMIQRLKTLNVEGGVIILTPSTPADDVHYSRYTSATFYLNLAKGLEGYGFVDHSREKLLGDATEIFASHLPDGVYLLTGGELGGFLMNSERQIIVPGLLYYREALERKLETDRLKRLPSDYIRRLWASATSHHISGRFQKAEKQYQEIITLLPRYSDAYINLGLLYWRMERFADAERVLQKALELDPSSAAAHLNLGLVYASKYAGTLEMYTKSTAEFEKAANLDPDMTRAHELLGTSYFMLREYQKAIVELEVALEQDPDLETARDFLIQAYEEVGLLEMARQHRQKLQELQKRKK